MPIRVGINGFGRIGRLVFRGLVAKPDVFEVAGINDLADNRTLATLLKYDSIHRRFPGTVEYGEANLIVNGKNITTPSERNPAELPWGNLGANVVLESTGVFRARKTDARAGFDSHLDAGAKKVVISAPAKGPDLTCILGVNNDKLSADHKCISNANSTAHCIAPVVKVLNEQFGIVKGLVTTMHAYTNDQVVHDYPHSDLYRARAAAQNIIAMPLCPMDSVTLAIPEIKGKLSGHSVRVPVPVGCMADLVVETAGPTTANAVNAAIKEADSGKLQGILKYCEDPIVSSDIIGDTHSSIFAADLTRVIGDRMLKVVCWNDNEWSYSCRCVELIENIGQF